ncbi:Piso0_000388 [Millerozyma farinosa CBS 7064]|uniref:Piso0_000388 protein n=1 Tax=Pichia sorbitophila (strain ATCC MYA-4447 / BCRC 22081 / CBS 7064 / NBRC 10061 / NRRL Y-12695) TaxID=559304 RepID=G8YVB1_PICSO|nr:Piso0_000388 [Millerozyma farinosa CBS 7064]CCE73355.1 Piso0_000388 [Millerozyma farinosa CBS 7064]
MYQPQNYYQNLGTAGHRASSSYSYVSQLQQGNYYNQLHDISRGARSYYPGMQSAQNASVQGVQQQYMMPPMAGQTHVPPVLAPPPVYQNAAPAGGFNPVLEYDLDNMASFLGWCTFGMLKQDRNPSKDFDKLIKSVLYATRLPKSTIIVALEYLNQRFSSKNLGSLTESQVFIKLIMSLILGNKFNDDNTFTNRSWAGASGINIEILNKEEAEWLEEVEWSLNVVLYESNICTLEECWKTWLEKHGKSPSYVATSSPSFNPYSSVPSSPAYNDSSYSYSYSSPVASSPIKYSNDSMWLNNGAANNNIWSYTPSYQYVPNIPGNNFAPDYASQYYGASNYMGYANPYYSYNLASC